MVNLIVRTGKIGSISEKETPFLGYAYSTLSTKRYILGAINLSRLFISKSRIAWGVLNHMKKSVRNLWTIGVVGLGAAARTIHLPAIRKIDNLKLVSGIDPQVDNDQFSFPIYDSIADMMANSSPDIIAIATPPKSHYSIICEGLESGAHIFCEKPFVLSLEEGLDVVKLSKKTGKSVVINNEFRFMNIHNAAQELITSPQFGDLLFVSMHQTFFITDKTEAGWRGDSDRRTCFEFGTHALDLCRFFFGGEPISLTSRMPKPTNPNGADNLNLIQLEFRGDRFAHITLDRLSRGPHRYLDIRLDGTKGTIETKLGGLAEIAVGIKGGTRKPFFRFELSPSGSACIYRNGKKKALATDPIDLFSHATAKLLTEMLHALETGEAAPCSAEDNLHTLALMLAAYDSAQEGGSRIEMKSYMNQCE